MLAVRGGADARGGRDGIAIVSCKEDVARQVAYPPCEPRVDPAEPRKVCRRASVVRWYVIHCARCRLGSQHGKIRLG